MIKILKPILCRVYFQGPPTDRMTAFKKLTAIFFVISLTGLTTLAKSINEAKVTFTHADLIKMHRFLKNNGHFFHKNKYKNIIIFKDGIDRVEKAMQVIG